jgi:predicted RNA-binding Zn-ribbon protein involved in translation (DUF1610 family)
MGKPKLISLNEVRKEDVAICPECGVLFVKTVKCEERSFWTGALEVHCPACDSVVVRKSEKG